MLYGPNGAGKSSALGALVSALSGRVDLPETRCDPGVTLVAIGFHGESQLLRGILGNRLPFGSATSRIRHLLSRAWPDAPESAVEEVVAAPILGFYPTGRGSARWDAWLCAAQETHPSAFRLRGDAEARWKAQIEVFKAVEEFGPEHRGLFNTSTNESLGNVLHRQLGEGAANATQSYLDAFWASGMPPITLASRFWDLPLDTVPRPLVRIGPLDFLDVPLLTENSLDVDEMTGRWVEDLAAQRWQNATHDEEDREFFHQEHFIAPWSEDSSELIRDFVPVVRQANQSYELLLQNPPKLELIVGDYVDWMAGRPCYWRADSLPLGNLSRAQMRWATIAIALALRPGLPLLVLDEPEAALHRSAEEHMARGLHALASRGATVVVATHAPDLLNLPQANVLECRKSDRVSSIQPLGDVRSQLEVLGLRPSDLLGALRTVVLVEGTHDELVVASLIGDRLRDSRARVFPTRGSRQAAGTLESRVLCEWTKAQIVLLLDKDADVDVQRLADECYSRVLLEGEDRAHVWLLEQFKHLGDPPNTAWIKELLQAALPYMYEDRIRVFVLAKSDMLEYLPPSRLGLPSDESWESLRAAANRHGRLNQTKFKQWLKNKGADLTPEAITEAAKGIAPNPPEEFLSLARMIEDLR